MGETIFWKRSSTQNIQFLSSKAETQRKPFYFGLTDKAEGPVPAPALTSSLPAGGGGADGLL